MALIDGPIAIKTLAKTRAVDKLLRLNAVRSNSTLAQDAEYQKDYKGYYRVGRKSSVFYSTYFSMLERAAASGVAPTLPAAMKELYDATKGERHLSFCTKLIATISDDAVIYDRNVAILVGVRTSSLPAEGWMEEATSRYDAIHAAITAATTGDDWADHEWAFDSAFPHGAALPRIRKADLLVWASY